jgi:hypothetical protein
LPCRTPFFDNCLLRAAHLKRLFADAAGQKIIVYSEPQGRKKYYIMYTVGRLILRERQKQINYLQIGNVYFLFFILVFALREAKK